MGYSQKKLSWNNGNDTFFARWESRRTYWTETCAQNNKDDDYNPIKSQNKKHLSPFSFSFQAEK